MMEGNRSNTNEAQLTNNPVWNEVLAFDIDHGKENLQIQLLDCEPDDGSKGPGQRKRTVIGEVEIDLKALSFEQQRWMQENPGKS